jgi:hypothetical protein
MLCPLDGPWKRWIGTTFPVDISLVIVFNNESSYRLAGEASPDAVHDA